MISQSVASIAAPAARFRTGPQISSTAAQEAVELAASAGLVLDPWQEEVLHDALGERADGRWAATEVGVVVPRQNGKGGILEARELAGLFLFGERVQTHTAHRFDTCLEHFRRMRTLIESTPDLDRRVKRIREANGDEGIELMSGARLNFKARSKGSGRGFSGDLVVLDEAYWLGDLGALIPTLSARGEVTPGGPQVWYTSSAPQPRAESDVLRKLCKRGRQGAPRLMFFEWSCPPGTRLDDRDAWRAANPAWDIRITEEFTQVERDTLDDEEFALERLGIWDEEKACSQVLPGIDWKACGADRFDLLDPVTLSLDTTPDRSATSLGSAGATLGADGIEVIDHRPGTSWVVARVVQIHRDHGTSGVVIDSLSQAATFVPELEAEGVPVRLANTADHKAAVAGLFDSVVDHDLTHLRQPELESAVAGATSRWLRDAWLFDRRAGADISPLVAVTLALWGHRHPLEPEPEREPVLW